MEIVLGVTGCIGAYKAAEIVRLLRGQGAGVQVILTRHARWFVTPGTMQTLSGRTVYSDLFRPRDPSVIEHVELARRADLLLVAPATANVIAKFACGIADDFLTTYYLAHRGPVQVAPAMNTGMYEHPAVRSNLETLAARGVEILGPGSGDLACGEVGEGRLLDPEAIAREALRCLRPSPSGGALDGRFVLVTSGPTREPIDPVRFLSNPASGRMGHALAAAARRRGARVVLISGPTALPDPEGVEVVRTTTARDMAAAVAGRVSAADVVLMAAAVGDYEAARPLPTKIKKSGEPLVLDLIPTPDILATLARARESADRPLLVGFAAETDRLLENARAKLESKQLDYVVANHVGEEGTGFGSPDNRVVLLPRQGQPEEWPLLSKEAVAERLLDRIVSDHFGKPAMPPRRAAVRRR